MKPKIYLARLSVLFSLLTILPLAHGVTIAVNGASGPWDVSLNPGYPYGDPSNVNLPPAVVDSSFGLAFTPGDSLLISSLTPGQPTLLAGAYGSLWCDANGVTDWPPNGPTESGYYVYLDTGTTVYLEELLGTFAQNGVIVETPFAIGNGPTTVTIPEGANQLLLGVSDGWYNDNGGSVNVSITEVPEPATFSLLALGGLALLWRKQGKV